MNPVIQEEMTGCGIASVAAIVGDAGRSRASGHCAWYR